MGKEHQHAPAGEDSSFRSEILQEFLRFGRVSTSVFELECVRVLSGLFRVSAELCIFCVQTSDLSIQTVYTLHNSVAGVIGFMYAHCGYLQ